MGEETVMNVKRIQSDQSFDQGLTKGFRSDERNRNGSALLIVIGTLALIAVFAAVYIAIGRTDRRSARAVLARQDSADTADQISDYLSSVIRDDRLGTVVQYGNSGSSGLASAFGLRDATDRPYTGWDLRSATDSSDEHLRFLPTGGIYSLGSLNGGEDFRVASDPWLASTTPVYLGNPGDSGVDRPFSLYNGFDIYFPNAKNFLDNRDWLQISNFSPDGRFVNLYNLRPNRTTGFNTPTVSSTEVGGFSAEPGVGTSPNADGRQIRRMSNFLSLWNLESFGDPESLIQTFDPMNNSDAVWVPDQNVPVNIGETELWNIPAVWTMYQRFLFMPINQPFITLNRNGDISTWADPDYPVYQYADADGDGMADSRWMELNAARDFNFDSSGTPREDIESLFSNKDYRFFVAARTVDLSSMVNVNTATDLLVPPTIEYPLGLTPADVDLRRLLTMQDPAGDYTYLPPAATNKQPLSYGLLHRPYAGPGDVVVGQWDPSLPGQVGFAQNHFNRDVTDYWVYRHQSANDARALYDNSNSMLIGRYAYEALRQGIVLGNSLGDDYKGFASNNPTIPTPSREQLREFERDPTDFNPVPGQITAEQRYEQYRNLSGLNPTDRAVAWSQNANFGSGLYGIDDLAELLSFHGLNDPEITTRLERVTTGRYESQAAGGFNDVVQALRLGPLMSNRPLSLDRDLHGNALIDITGDPSQAPSSQNLTLREVNGRISFNSMATFALTPRNKMTTISGSVPFLPTERFTDPSELEGLTALSAAPNLSDVIGDPNALFALYTNALIGEINAPKPINFMANSAQWPVDPALFASEETSTLFYGDRGPEVGMRITAHTTVNMADIIDSDTDPTVATLILDNTNGAGLRTYVDNGGFSPTGDAEYSLYPGAASGNLFDPGQNQLGTGNLPAERQLVNVYGMEAMPVLTEVSVMYAYTDAPYIDGTVGGDKDYNDASGQEPRIFQNQVIYPVEAQIEKITIDGEQTQLNDDYLVQVLAFQLHNPYDHSISLGGSGLANDSPLTRQRVDGNDDQIDTASNYQFDYYIEFSGRFYKVAKYLEWYPTTNHPDGAIYSNLDDPATIAAYGTVPNPSDDFPVNTGGRMDPGTVGFGGQATYSDFITRNVVLGPQETRVFYVIPEKRFDDATPTVPDDGVNPDDKWARSMIVYGELPPRFNPANIDPPQTGNDADGDGLIDGPSDTRGWTGPAEQWVEHQFKVRGRKDPVMMMEFDPRDGTLIEEVPVTGLEDPTATNLSPLLPDMSRNDNLEIRLWKKITATGEESTDSNLPGGERTPRNVIANDMLVDRMELTSPFTAMFGAASGPEEIDQTVSFREDLPTAINGQAVRNDNTGISIVKWRTQRRSDSDTITQPQDGEVTPWMMRSRSNPAATSVRHDTTLSALPGADEIFEQFVANPEVIPTISPEFEIHASLRDMFDVSNNGSGQEIIQTIALQPWAKSNVGAGGLGVVEDDTGNDSEGKFPSFVLPISGTGLEDQRSLILTSGNPIGNAPRLADLLLAWGIGPTYAPDPTRVAGSNEYEESEWLTGPEAIAVAMGIDNPVWPDASGFVAADDIWVDAYNQSNNQKRLFDDGHLVLDDFVSYLNVNAAAEVGFPPEFTVSNPPAPGDDIPRGTGVPVALGVIDQARAVERVALSTDPMGTLSPRDQLELLLSRPTMGTININTAPIEVLRLLPGLTPSRQEYSDAGGTTSHEWWGTDLAGTNLPDNTIATDGDTLRENPDVASAIIAYRDRLYGIPNTAARADAAGYTNYDFEPLNFGLTEVQALANNMRQESNPLVYPTGTEPFDRSTMTGIDGLRQVPGFSSLGELLAVRIDPEFETTDSARWNITRHLSIDQYGYDDKFSGKDGVTTIMSQLFKNTDPGATVDDYAEKLAMANSVLGTLSVRSDFYAVWFVIQGYQESDVANLRPEDPLIPTIRKRYVMVVDRSNVIEPGDKPKILLMKELPL